MFCAISDLECSPSKSLSVFRKIVHFPQALMFDLVGGQLDPHQRGEKMLDLSFAGRNHDLTHAENAAFYYSCAKEQIHVHCNAWP